MDVNDYVGAPRKNGKTISIWRKKTDSERLEELCGQFPWVKEILPYFKPSFEDGIFVFRLSQSFAISSVAVSNLNNLFSLLKHQLLIEKALFLGRHSEAIAFLDSLEEKYKK